MIKKLFYLFAVLALLTLVCVSCKSTKPSNSGVTSGQTQPASGSGSAAGQTTPPSATADAPFATADALSAKVVLARQEIVDHGFAAYDPDSFERGNEIALTAKEQFDAGNKEDAIAKAKDALLHYNTVLEKGWTAYAGGQRALAVIAKT